MKVLITTIPFGDEKKELFKVLKKEKIKYTINPYNRKIKEKELKKLIHDYDFLIAGTEPITKDVLMNAKKLKMIARVGVGVGNIDLKAAKKMKIKISYTPNSPSNAVAEITIALILALTRDVINFNDKMHKNIWNKYQTNSVENSVVGIIGFGRIGKKVYKILKTLSPKKILIYDPLEENKKNFNLNIEFVKLHKIFQLSDIITIHVLKHPK